MTLTAPAVGQGQPGETKTTLENVEETDLSKNIPADITAEVEAEAEDGAVEVNPDEMANMLNERQQLQQTFTLKRTIDGELVESEKRTVTYSRDEPYRETEAGGTTIERLKSVFDGELLTRKEAYEEAKLDFIIADANLDGQMSEDEFSTLLESWRENSAREAGAPTKEIVRQRQYEAFLAEISSDAAQIQNDAYAKERFAFLSGMADTVSREDYVREYLLDFDSMDADKDTLLKGDELMRFRAINRGEPLDM